MSKEHFKKKLKKKWTNWLQHNHLYQQSQQKTITNLTDDIANAYIKENTESVTNYLRNKRVMKAQRKQMNAMSLLNNAF